VIPAPRNGLRIKKQSPTKTASDILSFAKDSIIPARKNPVNNPRPAPCKTFDLLTILITSISLTSADTSTPDSDSFNHAFLKILPIINPPFTYSARFFSF
jgi:hypothetical protein